MKAHTQLEFEASIMQGVRAADKLEDRGWLALECRRPFAKSKDLDFIVYSKPVENDSSDEESGDNSEEEPTYSHNFKTASWSGHVVQIEGYTVPALVVTSSNWGKANRACLTIASAQGFGNGGVPARSLSLRTRVRSLGYVGSFLRQYGSAAALTRLDDSSSGLLKMVAAPGKHANKRRTPRGTFVPAANIADLDTSRVPLNKSQRDAVMNLNGGLDIIVGPPGKVGSSCHACFFVLQS